MENSVENIVHEEIIINEEDAIAVILRGWLDGEYSRQLHESLINRVSWLYDSKNIYGKEIKVPRGMFFLGDSAVGSYSYGGRSYPVQSWEPLGKYNSLTGPTEGYIPLYGCIRKIRDLIIGDPQINNWIGLPLYYNSCLLNYYRDGKDSIYPHSDREALGPKNAVIGISLGGTRKFVFKSKTKGYDGKYKRIITDLNNGDLLIMAGRCQELWTHEVPKENNRNNSRISMTFRFTASQ